MEAARGIEGGEEAIIFGNLADPDSDISRILREKHTVVRRATTGNGPNVYYIV